MLDDTQIGMARLIGPVVCAVIDTVIAMRQKPEPPRSHSTPSFSNSTVSLTTISSATDATSDSDAQSTSSSTLSDIRPQKPLVCIV